MRRRRRRPDQITLDLDKPGDTWQEEILWPTQVGDLGKVDPRVPLFHRQALHATRLGLLHPLTCRPQQWEAPPPADMLALLETLRCE